MGMIRFACPICTAACEADESRLGHPFECPNCGAGIAVGEGDGVVFDHSDDEAPEFTPAIGDGDLIQAISDHIERHIGPIPSVFHEIVSDLVHIDVHLVPAGDDRPYHTLVTSGMSDRPMTVPPDCDDLRFAELLVRLPADWPLDQESWKDERHYWPIRWLKFLARFPHQVRTFFASGHTIPTGDPPEPVGPGTALCGFLIAPSALSSEEFDRLVFDDDRVVNFYAVWPLYEAEMEFKLREGSNALWERFAASGITEVIDPGRENVCAGN